jgi:hypothetical protein
MKRLTVLPVALVLLLPADPAGGRDLSMATHDHLTIPEAKGVIKRETQQINRRERLKASLLQINQCVRLDRRKVRCQTYEEGADANRLRYTCRGKGEVTEYHTYYGVRIFGVACRFTRRPGPRPRPIEPRPRPIEPRPRPIEPRRPIVPPRPIRPPRPITPPRPIQPSRPIFP